MARTRMQVMDELDRRTTQQLARELGLIVACHLRTMPHSQRQVLEALNALAATAGYLLDGAGGEADDFFRDALALNRRDHP